MIERLNGSLFLAEAVEELRQRVVSDVRYCH